MAYFASPRYHVDPLVAAFLSAAAPQPHPQQQRSSSSSSASAQPAARKPCRPVNRSVRAFSPNFDVFETDAAYILDGELPGLSDKKALDIEFSDDRTLLVRGRIERRAPTLNVPDTETETEPQTETETRSLNPTVEDTDDDDDDFSVVAHAGKEAGAEHKDTVAQHKKEAAAATKPDRKTWVAERTFGSFQRTFSFPNSVELEEVKAELESGVLRITVPKRVSRGSRRIEIS